MKTVRKKIITGAVVLLLLSTLFGVFLYRIYSGINKTQDLEKKAIEIKSLSITLEESLNLSEAVNEFVLRDSMTKEVLSASACMAIISQSWDGKVRFYQNGAIVKVTGDEVQVPEDFPEDVLLDTVRFDSKQGVGYTSTYKDEAPEGFRNYYVYYTQVNGPFYYIEWEEALQSDEKGRAIFDLWAKLGSLENAFQTKLLIFNPDEELDGNHSVYYNTSSLPDYQKVEEYGITQEMISGKQVETDKLDSGTLEKGSTIQEIDGEKYRVLLDTVTIKSEEQRRLQAVKDAEDAYDASAFRENGQSRLIQKEMENPEVNGGTSDDQQIVRKLMIAFLDPVDETKSLSREQAVIILILFVMVGIVLLVWLGSVYLLIGRFHLDERQKKELSLHTTVRKMISLIAAGGAVILILSALIMSLFRINVIRHQVDIAFATLRQRIEENAYQKEITVETRKKSYMESASLVAGILTQNPEFASAENLQSICDVLGADYIMLFDENGNEYLSNSRYVGLSLGKSSDSATYDFRLLLNGVPVMAHEAVKDETTQLTNVMIGACLGDGEDNGKYGALLMAVPEDEIYGYAMENTSDIMYSLVADQAMAFSMDPETGIIQEASDPSLKGESAVALGLPEAARNTDYMDFFYFSGQPFYGENDVTEDATFFYAYKESNLFDQVLVLSFMNVAAYLVLMSVLAVWMITGYRKFFDEWAGVGETLQKDSNSVRSQDGKAKYSIDPIKRWRPEITDYGLRTPFHNAVVAMEIMLIICILVMAAWMFIYQNNNTSSLIGYILHGKWTKGFNLFAFAAILIMLGQVYTVVTLLRLVLYMISTAMGTRGETVLKLLMNLLRYASVIAVLYFAMLDLGFNPTTLLASLGLMSFALSLGAKDLVTDIVAGLFIVLEGEYQVGDIIDVGGYRGEVLEIGIRTTKVEGRGGNIKIIANRDVRNVINMTRKNSWYAMEIQIGGDQSLEEIEKLLTAQLPEIGRGIPEIISGPYYKGVIFVGNGMVTLSIIAECNEADYYRVQRALNREIRLLFENRHIPLL